MKIQRQTMTRSLKQTLFPWLAFAVLAPALPTLLSACSNMMTNNPNREPVVNIAPAAFSQIYPGNPVTFDATGSSDPDDQDLEVRWRVIDSPAGATFFLDNPRSFRPTFTTFYRNSPGAEASDRWVVGPEDYSVPPYLGNYTLRMTVTDEYGVSRSSNVTVNVANAAPGADAGGNRFLAVAPGADLNLLGTGGGNEESSRRNTWQYRWIVLDQPHGSQFSLTDPNTVEWASDGDHWTDPSDPDAAETAEATFSPLTDGDDENPGRGVYTLRLRVRDEYGAISDSTIIVETTGNTAPVLNAARIDDISLHQTIANPVAGVTQGLNLVTKNDDATPLHIIETNAEADTLTAQWTLGAHDGLTTPVTLWVNGSEGNYNIGNTLHSEDVARTIPGVGGIDTIEDLELWPESGSLSFLGAFDSVPGIPPATWNVRIDLTVSDGVVSKDDTVFIYLNWTP